jgi:hypothetical protein
MRSAALGSFKIPSLRNVELTGPYMHNGGMATLEEVLEFYTRGGNFEPDAKHIGTVFPQTELRFDAGMRADIIAFLHSLTDDRVRYERAPFDHPELRVPHGHAGDHVAAIPGNPLAAALARDEFLVLPAVGAQGRVEALAPFDAFLGPCAGECGDAVPLDPLAPPDPIAYTEAEQAVCVPEPAGAGAAALAALLACAASLRRAAAGRRGPR